MQELDYIFLIKYIAGNLQVQPPQFELSLEVVENGKASKEKEGNRQVSTNQLSTAVKEAKPDICLTVGGMFG